MATVNYTVFDGEIVEEDRGGTKRGYVPDPLGSTKALVDSAGAVQDTWEYWPYGEVESHTGSSTTPFTFVGTLGYFRDLVSSLTYVRARFYQALIGQWMTKDPLWPRESSYAYCVGYPTGKSDISGLAAQALAVPVAITIGVIAIIVIGASAINYCICKLLFDLIHSVCDKPLPGPPCTAFRMITCKQALRNLAQAELCASLRELALAMCTLFYFGDKDHIAALLQAEARRLTCLFAVKYACWTRPIFDRIRRWWNELVR